MCPMQKCRQNRVVQEEEFAPYPCFLIVRILYLSSFNE